MASNGVSENLGYGDPVSTNADTSAAEAALKARLSRRRTKTGCLTCRKRRIKCGEERPVCKNCIKSKRQCEGYSQRVVFKQPTLEYQQTPNGAAHITFQAGPLPGPLVPYDREYGHVVTDPSFYSQQQPNPAGQYISTQQNIERRHTGNDIHKAYLAPAPGPQSGVPYHLNLAVEPTVAYHQNLNGTQIPHHRSQSLNSSEFYSAQSQAFIQPVDYATHANLPPVVSENGQPNHQPEWQHPYQAKFENWPPTTATTNAIVGRELPTSNVSSKKPEWSKPFAAGTYNPGWNARPHMVLPEPPRTLGVPPPNLTSHSLPTEVPVTIAPALQAQIPSPPEFYEHEQPLPIANTTNNLLSQAAVESQDDDYYDVDEEMDVDTLAMTTIGHEQQQNLQRILQMNNIGIDNLQSRGYDTFLYKGILDRYRVEDAASPLKNPATARVFAHFISVTAPSISAFERTARKSSILFNDGQIPLSQRGLWTYTMPLAALHHQGLLHSMLALASLHIARLQDASDTPSRQHYAWACKRINHLLEPNSKKRHKTTTIAASMLLGFYEIFTADHRAWNLHLTGSRQLFAETDFLSMSRQFRRMKRERIARQQIAVDPTSTQTYSPSQDEMLDQACDFDEELISHLCGYKVNYDDPFQRVKQEPGVPQQLDVKNFENLRDLYFWYLKQDAVQCFLSGNPLLLDFGLWANCPPRAPLGRVDAVHGSFDHLILLLGRIAEFSSRDRRRKLRQMEANGGQWRPAPGMKIPQTQGPHRSQPTTPMSATNGQPPGSGYFAGPPPQVAPQPQQPQFFGMAPPPRENVQMPSAYNPAPNVQTPQPVSPKEETDLRAATSAALEEYGRIRAALHEFKNNLGDAFNPLPDEYQVPLESPFGNALIYRSYDISCLWAWYHMAVIVAIRSHPHMHPAAHAAAAIASQETAYSANEIGRIFAGIVPGPSDQPINPTLGAALWDSCIPSFFAAIQYHDSLQRHATVMRIHNIAVRTGWGTAETIANGCETAWVKAAAAGRGPMYTRVVRREYSDDPRLDGRGDHTPRSGPDEKDVGDRRLAVKTKAEARLTWAIGILGTEEDENSKATNLEIG